MNKLAEIGFKSKLAWDYMRPLRTGARVYSWGFGWPLITRGADMGMRAGQKSVDSVEIGAYTAAEAAKGAGQMTVSPLAILIKSRLTTIKRFMWDVPWASVGAAVRTPLAILKSPLEMFRGVEEAIGSIRGNVKELFNSVTQLKLMDTVRNIRNLVGDALLPPITRPVAPILQPAGNVASTAFEAEFQTVSRVRDIITEVIPGGWNRITNSHDTGKAIFAQKYAGRMARKAEAEKLKQEEKEAVEAQIRESRGKAAPGGGKSGKK